jgi:two-component system NtrC family sensor kinase
VGIGLPSRSPQGEGWFQQPSVETKRHCGYSAAMKARRESAVRSLKFMMVGTVLFPLALFAFASFEQYNAISRLADERIARSLDICVEHASKIFQSIEIVLASIDEITRGRAEQSLRLHEAELSERLKLMAAAIADIQSIWLFDTSGTPVAASTTYPVSTAINYSDRDYFLAQLDRDAGTYIGSVLKTESGSRPFFSVSRKRSDSSGDFSGVTAIALSPSAFEQFYEHLARNTDASYAMIRADGVVLARYPVPANPGMVLDKNSGFRRTVAQNPDGGQYTAVSGIDGVERRFDAQRLGDLPVYVTSSLEYSNIRGQWIQWMEVQLLFGIPVTALLLLLEYLALRRTNDFYAEAFQRETVEAALRQTQKMEAVGQLTGGIAHDFNNLLTIIIGNLQSVVRQVSDGSKLHQKIANALIGAERAAQLTHRLLAFSRRQPLDPKPVDANQLIARTTELLIRSLGERIHIETVRGAGLWQIEVDPAELESAVINLSINARDAMPGGGKITIETGNAFLDEAYCEQFEELTPGQYVLICVSDEGVGMPADVVERAFDPFFTTKEPGLGTGLGLSQVYGFVKQSGGHIQIYSEIGIGTSAKIYLPRSFALGGEDARSGPDEIPQGRGESILIVEDDDGVRNTLFELLTELNYSVKAASGSEAARVMIDDTEQRIDLLLTDVVMPGMNGRQLADVAVTKRPGLRILFMTGYSRNAIVHQGRLDPGVSLIQKPVSEHSLAMRVRSMLDE